MKQERTIAFLGLGVMGGPMAGHLAAAGYTVRAWNRSEQRRSDWADRQSTDAQAFATIAEAVEGAHIVAACVGNDDDLAQVVLGPKGALAAMSSGALLIDHTTTSAAMARRVAGEAAGKDIGFVDAPVSGGQAGAENGKLAIMCGASADDFTRAEPVMQSYAARIVHVGDVGAGQTAKMANQMCIAGTLAGLSEAIRLSQASGLDTDKVFEAISGGAAQSWQMDNRWATMAQDEFNFGFAIDWMRKDLGYALDEAKRLGLASPVSALVDQFYAEIQAMGGARQDTSALIRRLPKGNTPT